MPLDRDNPNRLARLDAVSIWAVCLVLSLMAMLFPAMAQAPATNQPPRVDHRNSVAVIIGNSKYEHTTPVPYAHNDARAIQDYLVKKLGFRRDNIILRLDLGRERMETLFGEPDRPDGELMDRLLDRRAENRGDVFVFYSGHGVPDPDAVRDDDRRAFLLPVDVRQDRITAAAYPIDRLQKKLDVVRGSLPEGRNVVLMLDACFSGRTPNPKVAEGDASLFRFSRGSFTARVGQPQAGLVRLVAATGDQVAYWDEKSKLGLFTSLFLKAVGGEADSTDFGNGDKLVDGSELTRYLEERLPAEARNRHQRSQRPTLESLEKFSWTAAAVSPAAIGPVVAPVTPRPVAPAPAATPAALPTPAPAATPAPPAARPTPAPAFAARPPETEPKPVVRPTSPARPPEAARPRRPAPAAAEDDDEEEVRPAPRKRTVRPRPEPAPERAAAPPRPRVSTPAAEPTGGCRVINGVRFCG
jgi:Caspase domain